MKSYLEMNVLSIKVGESRLIFSRNLKSQSNLMMPYGEGGMKESMIDIYT
jgi:hypothetical protein